MKTRLLRKVKSRIKIYKRGNSYKVHNIAINKYSPDLWEETAIIIYRTWVIEEAKRIFGYRPKEVLR